MLRFQVVGSRADQLDERTLARFLMSKPQRNLRHRRGPSLGTSMLKPWDALKLFLDDPDLNQKFDLNKSKFISSL